MAERKAKVEWRFGGWSGAPAAAVAALFALALPLPAAAQPVAAGAVVGTSAGEIEAALAAAGCEMTSWERGRRTIEAGCRQGMRDWDITVDATTGTVRRVERD